jgi:hypothetical protein
MTDAILELRVMAVELRRGADEPLGKSSHAVAGEIRRLADEIQDALAAREVKPSTQQPVPPEPQVITKGWPHD